MASGTGGAARERCARHREQPAGRGQPGAATVPGRAVMSVMTPLPIEIGAGSRLLAGQYQQAHQPLSSDAADSAPKVAVLMCNPFGQEAVRCHRAFRLLSDRLARMGVPSLRFDYYATGESPGDDGEGDLDRWRQDVALAHGTLALRSGARAIAWVGLRLGAAIALAAAPEASPPPARVILWDPVIDGGNYLEELSAHHAFWTRRRGVTSEVLGFRLPAQLRAQIATLDLPAALAASSLAVGVVFGRGSRGNERLQERLAGLAPRVRCESTGEAIAWCSNQALGSRWVPSAALERIVAQVTGDALDGEGARTPTRVEVQG
jgi:uncharacterized protein